MSLQQTIKHEVTRVPVHGAGKGTRRKILNFLTFVYFVSFVFEIFLWWSHK